MQKTMSMILAASLVLLLAACNGNAAKDKKAEIADLKAKLEKLKKEKNGLDVQIRQVEEQLAKADPTSLQTQKLVTVDTVTLGDFNHFIELQGKIDAEDVAYVSPSGMGGVIKAVYVKAGSSVSKGQTILKLDDALARQGVSSCAATGGGLESKIGTSSNYI